MLTGIAVGQERTLKDLPEVIATVVACTPKVGLVEMPITLVGVQNCEWLVSATEGQS